MVAFRPLTQERVNLVEEDYARLALPCKAEHSRDELVALSKPFVGEDGGGNVDEGSPRLSCESLREHGLPTSWWSKEEYTFRRRKEGGRREEVWVD